MTLLSAHPKAARDVRVDFFFRLDSRLMDATDLAFAGIARQAELIAAGEVSSRELVELYLERIARLDPKLNAFRVVFEERARMEADQADARRGAGGESSQRPLLGVPIAVKDEIDVAGEVTALGTNAYGEPAQADAEIVRRLREAGAVVIGKTQRARAVHLALHRDRHLGRDAQPVGAPARPGGSSGGSAAAVAAGLVGAALAGDGGGIDPHTVGIVRPVRAEAPAWRVSAGAARRSAWHGLVVYGVLTRSVRDTALCSTTWPRAARRSMLARVRPPEISFLPTLCAHARPDGAHRAVHTLPPGVIRRLDDAPGAPRCARETLSCCGRWGTRFTSASPTTARSATLPAFRSSATCAASTRRRGHVPHPERLERRTRQRPVWAG